MNEKEVKKTRYRVKNDYPGCPWKIDRILIEIAPNVWDCPDAPTSEVIRNPGKYPHLFERLPD